MIGKPKADDFREGASMEFLREAGAIANESSSDLRSATARLVRMLAAAFVAPALLLSAYLSAGKGQPLVAALLPLAIGLTMWWLFVRPGMARRSEALRQRRERIDQCEDVAALRAQALRAEAPMTESAAS